MSSMACDRQKMDDYIGALKAVVSGDVVRENLKVILEDAKKLHEEAGIKLTEEFVTEVEEMIKVEIEANQTIFENILKTVQHIYEQAESTGAFLA